MDGKKALNVNLDKDVADFFSQNYPGITSRIINQLSKEFKDEVTKDPSMLQEVIHGNIGICKKKTEINQ